MDRKRVRLEKIKSIHARRDTYEIQQVMSLLDDIFAEKRDALVDVKPEDFVGKQGEARAIKEIIDLIRKDRPKIEQPAQE